MVPLEDVKKFVTRAQEVTKGLSGNEGLLLAVKDGEHGFDGNVPFEEPWDLVGIMERF
ncbi:hypothetical protein V1505DRAFT_357747 [Lipomyces doorenjongii]